MNIISITAVKCRFAIASDSEWYQNASSPELAASLVWDFVVSYRLSGQRNVGESQH